MASPPQHERAGRGNQGAARQPRHHRGRAGTSWLLDLHANGKLPAGLKPETARLLRNSPFVDLRNRALIAFPPPGKLDVKKLPSIAELTKRRGNVERGAQLLVASAKND